METNARDHTFAHFWPASGKGQQHNRLSLLDCMLVRPLLDCSFWYSRTASTFYQGCLRLLSLYYLPEQSVWCSVESMQASLLQEHTGKRAPVSGYSTGWPDLDRLYGVWSRCAFLRGIAAEGEKLERHKERREAHCSSRMRTAP